MSDIEKKVNDAELDEVAGGAVNTNYFVYTIVYGDTLSAIALRFHTTVAVLVQLNHIANPNLIYAGNKLIIPRY
jgi:LysM repeat protein